MDIKNEDNRVTIGDGNRIRNSVIGSNNDVVDEAPKKVQWYSKLFWKIVIPIAVIVIATIIIWFLNLK